MRVKGQKLNSVKCGESLKYKSSTIVGSNLVIIVWVKGHLLTLFQSYLTTGPTCVLGFCMSFNQPVSQQVNANNGGRRPQVSLHALFQAQVGT